MRRIALYGKGGIGKSTISSNITAALAKKGLKVIQIGCDPKSDSTKLLTNGNKINTILNVIKDNPDPTLNDLIYKSDCGAHCIECGGPKPGMGCAGRGIIAAFETLERLDMISRYSPDVIIYDVLGDVVCGGFAMPIRNGYARDVFIVTSGEMMSLYAANNIAEAVQGFSEDGYARLEGIIHNSRNVENEDSLVERVAKDISTEIIYKIPRNPIVQECENKGKTVVEGAPDSEQAKAYMDLADIIFNKSDDSSGGMKLK